MEAGIVNDHFIASNACALVKWDLIANSEVSADSWSNCAFINVNANSSISTFVVVNTFSDAIASVENGKIWANEMIL